MSCCGFLLRPMVSQRSKLGLQDWKLTRYVAGVQRRYFNSPITVQASARVTWWLRGSLKQQTKAFAGPLLGPEPSVFPRETEVTWVVRPDLCYPIWCAPPGLGVSAWALAKEQACVWLPIYLGVWVLCPGLDSMVLMCGGYQCLPGNDRNLAVGKCSPILHGVFIPGESAQHHQ